MSGTSSRSSFSRSVKSSANMSSASSRDENNEHEYGNEDFSDKEKEEPLLRDLNAFFK